MSAPTWDHPRSNAAARILAELGADRGVSITDVLASTGMRPDDLTDPMFEVEAGQELTIARNLIRALGDPPGLGVDAGMRYTIGHFGIWAYAMLSSPTLRDLVRIGVRYAGLSFAFIQPSYEEDAVEGRVVFDDIEIPLDARAFFVERELTKLAVMMPFVLSARHVDVRFETSLDGSDAAALRERLPHTSLLTSRERHVIAFNRAALDAPLPQADPVTAAILEQQCADLLQARRRRRGIASHVRSMILARLDESPSMEQIAGELHVDPRTLRRQLLAEGTSFRELSEEVRATIADELLGSAGLTVHDVAGRLGYHDAAGFTRAYRRWTGTTPGRGRDLAQKVTQRRSS
jgi:AraC-like DNA-binding protein